MIHFNRPYLTGKETDYIRQAVEDGKISGNGEFTHRCQEFFERRCGFRKCLLTTSCTDALEMAAILSGVGPGDEVIVPSYTFVSSALAFVRQGAKVVFADSRADEPNIDAAQIEALVTPRTKVIVPVHYAGCACDMDAIMAIAERHGLIVVEDAAQAVESFYTGGDGVKRPLGSIGHLACFSFHETKNYSMGEGGALLIRDPANIEAAEIIREKGTNRSKFFRGQIDKYTWVSYGSSYLPSELCAAYLWAQLERAETIFADRMASWNAYYERLAPLAEEGRIELPVIPEGCSHNAHMFYIKAKDLAERTALIAFLKERGVCASFHYIPLHSAPAGLKYGRFHGEDRWTTRESERLLRLPLFYGLSESELEFVCEAVGSFYSC